MTTKKPEVLGYATSEGVHRSQSMAELLRLTGELPEPLIRLSDYEALKAEREKLRKDAARLDWLADPSNHIGNVQLPTAIVEQYPHSLREAIDAAMQHPPE